MRVILKRGILAITPESDEEARELRAWRAHAADHVFHLPSDDEARGLALHDCGPRDEACAQPINITFDGDARWRPISNLAPTPFSLDERHYASVEGFWQGLKFADAAERARIAGLSGVAARNAGRTAPQAEHFTYEGERVTTGTYAHWRLMARACQAKFLQHGEARAALLATAGRPLMHRVRRDSRTIPGVIMAEIWTRIREALHRPAAR